MIIDTTDSVLAQIAHLQADKVSTVIRYLTRFRLLKLVKPAEAQALGAAGIRLGLVLENGGGAPGYHDISASDGAADADFCMGYLPLLKAPADGSVCVYFAIDNDLNSGQINAMVLPYFEAINEKIAPGTYMIGVYGSGLVCEMVFREALCTYTWLSGSLGWTNSRSYLAAKSQELRLVQDKMDTKIANMDCDTDYALGDFGDYLPVFP